MIGNARGAICRSTLRQLGIAKGSYDTDYQDRLASCSCTLTNMPSVHPDLSDINSEVTNVC